MKVFLALGAAAIIATAGAMPAQARQGCGPGSHRTPSGMCRPNRGQVMWVEGRYYPGHGYWYNNGWHPHRYRWHGQWRYR